MSVANLNEWRRFKLLLTAILAVSMGSCSSVPSSHGAKSNGLTTFTKGSTFGAGADPAQQAVIADGKVTFPEYEQAVGETIQCLRDAGIDVVGDTVTTTHGFPLIDYSWSASSQSRTDAQTKAIGDNCIRQNSQYIEALYQTSPAVIQAQDAQFANYRAPLVACIRGGGVSLSSAATRDDILLAASQLRDAGGTDCIAKAGYSP